MSPRTMPEWTLLEGCPLEAAWTVVGPIMGSPCFSPGRPWAPPPPIQACTAPSSLSHARSLTHDARSQDNGAPVLKSRFRRVSPLLLAAFAALALPATTART